MALRLKSHAVPERRPLDTIAAAQRRALPVIDADEALDAAVTVMVALRREGATR
ncbi:MAG: hypothetical protein ACRCT8_12240 [Lacipirellulaceae bacterium]